MLKVGEFRTISLQAIGIVYLRTLRSILPIGFDNTGGAIETEANEVYGYLNFLLIENSCQDLMCDPS